MVAVNVLVSVINVINSKVFLTWFILLLSLKLLTRQNVKSLDSLDKKHIAQHQELKIV